MIGKYDLLELLKKYNIDGDKLISKNSNVLTYGEYIDIDKTLDYLVNTLKIHSSNIEKCPSILYRNVGDIKQNVNFLRSQKIVFNNIESCLHVLSSKPNELIETYKYVKNNYNENIINRITSILSVPKKIIIDVEKLNIPFVNKVGNLSVAVGIEWGCTELEEVKKIIQSKEYKEHPELFTSQTLARAKLEEIQRMIQSKEYKEHPELFTSQTLAHAKFEEIQKMIQSKEYKEHPELFTSETLAHAKLEEIQKLLKMEFWKDERFKKLLTSSIVAKSKSIINKLPILFEMAENYNIDKYLTTSFLLLSPSQNYAIINYLISNDLPLVIDNKLNPIFGKQPGVLKNKYNIDLKELMTMYPLNQMTK